MRPYEFEYLLTFSKILRVRIISIYRRIDYTHKLVTAIRLSVQDVDKPFDAGIIVSEDCQSIYTDTLGMDRLSETVKDESSEKQPDEVETGSEKHHPARVSIVMINKKERS